MGELKSIDVMSLAKMMGMFGVVIGFILGLFLAIGFSVVGPLMGSLSGMDISMFSGLGIGIIIVLPVIYGILMFIQGLLIAIIYNFLASKIGGVKLDIEG